MFRINAFSKKGTRFRFRIQSNNIQIVRDTLKAMFDDQEMRLILVEPV